MGAIPHATHEHREAADVGPRGTLCTTICQECVRNAVAAWAVRGLGKLSAAEG